MTIRHAEGNDLFAEREGDSLGDLHAERVAAEPAIASLVAAASARRAFARELAAERKRAGLSQRDVAARMGTSQGFVSRFERALVDAQHSTEDRYANAIGRRIDRRLTAL
jgi:ribosome-binding protein aMBF1 (putative translation factor)